MRTSSSTILKISRKMTPSTIIYSAKSQTYLEANMSGVKHPLGKSRLPKPNRSIKGMSKSVKVMPLKSTSKIAQVEMPREALTQYQGPPYAYRDDLGRSLEHRIMVDEVKGLLSRNTRARTLQEGEHLLVFTNRGPGEAGQAALVMPTAVDWPAVRTIHLVDSSGTLDQNLSIGPPTAPICFCEIEKEFILKKGKALEAHNSVTPFNRGVAVKSWAQIAMEFNGSFQGQTLPGEPAPRPWRSLQTLRNEYRRLTFSLGDRGTAKESLLRSVKDISPPPMRKLNLGGTGTAKRAAARKQSSIPRAVMSSSGSDAANIEVLPDGYVRTQR